MKDSIRYLASFISLGNFRMFSVFIKQCMKLLLLFHRAFFVHLVLSPTYALIYVIKILSQAITLVALFTPTCFDPYG